MNFGVGKKGERIIDNAASKNSIIDIHCHTAGIGAGGSGCFASPALMRSWKYRVYLRAFGVTEQELLEQGDGLILRLISERVRESERVGAAVILALDGVIGWNGQLDREQTEIYIPNEFLAAELRRYPNLLLGASVNPLRPDALERVAEAASAGAVLMKWLPSIQHFDPADRRLIPFYLKLVDLQLPLLTHTGSESSFTRSQNYLCDPERLRLPLELGVTVIAAHAAASGKNDGERNSDRFVRLCREHPNLFADISALTQLNRLGQLQRILRHRDLHNRLLYGSDMPLLNTALVTPFAFPNRLSPPRMLELARIKNPWDQDVALKEALGVPQEILHNWEKLAKGNRRQT